jgi:hypothetical protein
MVQSVDDDYRLYAVNLMLLGSLTKNPFQLHPKLLKLRPREDLFAKTLQLKLPDQIVEEIK